jgi:uncharacterized membrane protein YoaK (UPF0700 family)
LLGVELAAGNLTDVLHLALILLSFVAGAVVSGFVIGGESLKLGRRYSVALLAESALLLSAMVFLNRGSLLGHYLASGACGLQNAMTSTFSGAVVRTTHVTGLFTDLGVTLGLWLRGQRVENRRVLLYFTLIAGFILGGVFGALGFSAYRFETLIAPATLTVAMALACLLYWRRSRLPPVKAR